MRRIKAAAEVEAGDLVVFLGEAHLVTSVEAEPRSVIPGALSVRSGDYWRVTAGPAQEFEVVVRGLPDDPQDDGS